MRLEDLLHDDLLRLGIAAVVGVPHLAHELEELGISGQEDSLDDARAIMPLVIDALEEARRDG